MDSNTVFALLLDRTATTGIVDGNLTPCLEALDVAVNRRRHVALAEVFNKWALRCHGCARCFPDYC
jgi:rRNA maturation endonuclease Nob1